jgi:hypothetical protein
VRTPEDVGRELRSLTREPAGEVDGRDRLVHRVGLDVLVNRPRQLRSTAGVGRHLRSAARHIA